MVQFIRVTSYVKNPDYTEVSKIEGVTLFGKDQFVEKDAIVNPNDIVWVFPSQNGVGNSIITFRNNPPLGVKQTVDEVAELLKEVN